MEMATSAFKVCGELLIRDQFNKTFTLVNYICKSFVKLTPEWGFSREDEAEGVLLLPDFSFFIIRLLFVAQTGTIWFVSSLLSVFYKYKRQRRVQGEGYGSFHHTSCYFSGTLLAFQSVPHVRFPHPNGDVQDDKSVLSIWTAEYLKRTTSCRAS